MPRSACTSALRDIMLLRRAVKPGSNLFHLQFYPIRAKAGLIRIKPG